MPVSTADLVSPAMACLRVSILSPPPGQTPEDVQLLVAKVINAFLQSRWEWPRQFEQMTPYAFVLTDPRADRMDKRGLKALAGELQLKLFGSDGEGEVSLLLFEGSDMEVHRFARLSVDDVERLVAGEALHPPFEGSLDRIIAEGAQEGGLARIGASGAPRDARSEPVSGEVIELGDLMAEPAVRRAEPRGRSRCEAVYAGLYLATTQSFVGSLALCRRPRRDRHAYPDLSAPEALPGLAVEAFDEGCVDSALAALEHEVGGLLFVPLSFSSLVRPTGRRAYARFLCHLPAEARERLVAAVYDTPRAPSFFALSTIRRFLEPFFGEINLQVGDPAFEVERLPPDIVSTVTLALSPERDPAERLAAIRRFMQKREAYRKKRIWAGVAPLATRAEVEACLALRTPMMSGPAVAELSSDPIAGRAVDAEALPLKL